MTFIKIIDTFTFYGVDVLMLAFATTCATQIFKKFLFKNSKKKLVTFLPFIIGTFLYAAYAAIRNLNFFYIFEEYASIAEHGFSVGMASTVYYVLYEQFVREKDGMTSTEKIITTLIEGYIPADSVEKAAKAVAEAIQRDVTGNGAVRAQEILAEYSGEEVNERDIQLLSKLIIETLAHVTTVK